MSQLQGPVWFWRRHGPSSGCQYSVSHNWAYGTLRTIPTLTSQTSASEPEHHLGCSRGRHPDSGKHLEFCSAHSSDRNSRLTASCNQHFPLSQMHCIRKSTIFYLNWEKIGESCFLEPGAQDHSRLMWLHIKPEDQNSAILYSLLSIWAYVKACWWSPHHQLKLIPWLNFPSATET